MKYVSSAHPTELTFTGRAERIMHLLKVACVAPAETILDIGCGYGDIALGLANIGFQVIGADIFLPGVRAASKASSEMGLDAVFFVSPAESLPMKDQAVPTVVCYNIWEHVENPHALMNQIARVLRRGGVLFLVVPNRFWIMETHYKLPFLSWLPQHLADMFVRISGRGTKYDVNCPTWWELESSLKSWGFQVDNLNLYVLRNFKKLYPTPEYLGNVKYRIGSMMSLLLRFLPNSIGQLLSDLFSEAFFVVARSKSREGSSIHESARL
jgi:ubiquinone/menaquinone biosynthesis C-methylase UbiE